MSKALTVCAPKQAEAKKIPTAPVLKFSCYAFADHPPPTRESGQQNENIQNSRRGVKMINDINFKNKKEDREQEQKTETELQNTKNKQIPNTYGVISQKNPRATSWEANRVEINYVGTPCKEKQLLLEQLARNLYDYSCQLAKATALNTAAPCAPDFRRTGTDG